MFSITLGLAWLSAYSFAHAADYGTRRDLYRFLGIAYLGVHAVLGVSLWTLTPGFLIVPALIQSLFFMKGRETLL